MKKIKSFIEYLVEARAKSEISILRDIILTNYREVIDNEPRLKPNSSRPKEIVRWNLGTDANNLISKIKEMFNKAGIGDIEFDTQFQRHREASRKFDALKVIYHGAEYYITNHYSSKSSVVGKQLAPSNILSNAKDPSMIYSSINDIKSDIDMTKLYNTSDGVKDYCYSLIDNVENNQINTNIKSKSVIDFLDEVNPKVTNSDIQKAANEVEFNDFDKVIKVQIDEIKKSYVNSGLTPTDVNTILVDFGEILGPLLFLRLFKDAKITFPSAINSSLFDYNLNGVGISAKYKNGAPPSAKSIFSFAAEKMDNGDSPFSEEETDFINKFYNLINSGSIFNMIKKIVNDYILIEKNKRDNGLAKLFKVLKIDLMKISDEVTFNEIMLTKPKEDQYNLIKYVYDNYYNKKFEDPSNPVFVDYKNNINIMTFGNIMFPLYREAVKRVNELYAQLLTNVVNKTINGLQVYLDKDLRKSELILKIKKFSNSKFMFSVIKATRNELVKRGQLTLNLIG